MTWFFGSYIHRFYYSWRNHASNYTLLYNFTWSWYEKLRRTIFNANICLKGEIAIRRSLLFEWPFNVMPIHSKSRWEWYQMLPTKLYYDFWNFHRYLLSLFSIKFCGFSIQKHFLSKFSRFPTLRKVFVNNIKQCRFIMCDLCAPL